MRVILQGFLTCRLPTGPVSYQPFLSAPLENVRTALRVCQCRPGLTGVALGPFKQG